MGCFTQLHLQLLKIKRIQIYSVSISNNNNIIIDKDGQHNYFLRLGCNIVPNRPSRFIPIIERIGKFFKQEIVFKKIKIYFSSHEHFYFRPNSRHKP